MGRLRDLGIGVGLGESGPWNAITDVAGVRVGHTTLIEGEGALRVGHGPVHTGVTVLHPRAGLARDEPLFAGFHRLNGNGEMTGVQWIEEAGLLASPIALTNTHSVGVVRDALIALELRDRRDDGVYWSMPVVSETYDGLLSDIGGFHVREEHVTRAYDEARSGPVAEGAVGGGTGMICHEFKGGIGTASRVLAPSQGGFTVGALVQANHGRRERLCVDGYPVGRFLSRAAVPSPFDRTGNGAPIPPGTGSVVVVLATDAPLLPGQCTRLAQRASIGLARTGGGTEDSSGDLFIAFATGNAGLPRADYSLAGPLTSEVRMLGNHHLSALFVAAADAVEEAIINALLSATTITGANGVTAHGLRLDQLESALRQAGHPQFQA
ncbi:P1 family peptidase [Deinococcus peraridilitoris]|uniref:L-aminopeptidase/D-esterase n=1 Tax=Deinococcus peraridilitoris (strain DSM 19664 / LMG 22246 / CIP 109416 / KR-200) TaxID=937777 RepID=L0A2M9_DEIPD|nr:P1 family peptidase [Deinococcus peraridilitoris]AFZ68128.1 L-aminopeptidase/D-esterase [Deinococcus peraridilitoris DSM 19664]